MKKIVIIGGGYAGILTAKKLAKKFRKRPADVTVSVIDKKPFHTMLTELHEVAAGRVDEESVRISYKKVFAGRRIHFIHDTAESCDFKEKKVYGKNGDYEYDCLVIAAGSRPTFFGITGAAEYACPLWSYDDAISLRERIQNSFRKASSETNEEEKRRLLTFYVVGAGFTGIEMVGELAEYAPILCRTFELDPRLVTICNVDSFSRVVPNLPEKLSVKIQRRLEKMGVTMILNARVVEVGEGTISYERDGVTTKNTAGTVIWVAGIEGSAITQQAGALLESQKRGRLVTDKYLRSVDDPSVYVAGDNIFYVPEGEKVPVPQMVENCEQSADTVAHNIWCDVTGEEAKEEQEEYKPMFHGVMVSVGGRYGQARVGGRRHMVNLPSFFAMFVKHFINVIYFAQVLGWNKIASYLKHEFFTIRNKRSFLGGHFSNRTPSFLAVPLRLWLGVAWLFEGIMKIVEGWFSAPKLSAFFGSATQWFNAILGAGPQPTQAASDAVTSATGGLADTGAAAGRVLFDIDILGLVRALFVSGKPPADATFADYAFKLDIPFVSWLVNSLVLSSDGMQLFLQTVIVLLEILIGLSLLGGLFTTPSSVVALVLMFMFATTTGLFLTNFWMVFSAVAFLWGAGSVFGLDYYTTPLLKKHWRRVGWVRRSYLYHD
ncbi:NADH dehydrogenase [Sporobacter termitidis DSM 10068]|uniref:NADH:ubiquinone reductase (non-electrogenic) n=1 Tax=Sporobacter termitidis DSM 10068 TaxID=1123282 RepID=A0A1M5XR04_9FIRM|nr:NAD(P)/FAD-dependent oxidoreductase [Sporobacter termitidis]SHI02251.1 NADH dehydrogenase [Sporobacter termitidis DSM 10068]